MNHNATLILFLVAVWGSVFGGVIAAWKLTPKRVRQALDRKLTTATHWAFRIGFRLAGIAIIAVFVPAWAVGIALVVFAVWLCWRLAAVFEGTDY